MAKKKLVVVGDRVLIEPAAGEERTKIGLYLPSSAVDQQAVRAGTVVAVGPGNPLGPPSEPDEEPWRDGVAEPRYSPMQAREGDHALFFRKAAVEITFEGKPYLVVSQGAILALVRDEETVTPETSPEDDETYEF
ncbi:MAG: co-chaperone GroES [Gemmatimonadetes bacterium]|nr:co-chaperone GroES [Gemmatimonadota bacterium]